MKSLTASWLNRLEAKWHRELGAGGSHLIEQWLRTAAIGVQQKGERYYRRAQALFPTCSDSGQILDAGCGDGQIALRFALGGANVIGVDVDREFIDVAKLHAKEFPDINAQFLCADLCDSSVLTDFTFDLILSIDVIEHVPDPFRYLIGARNRLKPEGKIWLFTPHRFGWSNILADPHYKLAGLTLLPNAWAAWYAVNYRHKSRTYDVKQLYTPPSLSKLVESCGLTISIESTQGWNEVVKTHFWVKQLCKFPLVHQMFFLLYQYRLSTIEAILSVPSSS